MDNYTQRKSKQLKQRSQSVRNMKPPKNTQAYSINKFNDSNLLASKPSKQYNKIDYQLNNQKQSIKNNNQQSQYIKNLYKKYLGKENQIQSQKKGKTQSKPIKSILNKEDNREMKTVTKLFHDEPITIKNSLTQQTPFKGQYPDFQFTDTNILASKNKHMSSVQYSKDFRKNFTESESQLIADYKQFFKSDFILQVGDPRNSLIRCLKNISNFKKSMKSK